MLSGLRSNLQVGFDLCPPLWLRPPLVAPQSSSPQGYARRLLALAVHSLPAYLGRVYLGFKSLPPAACGSNSNLQVGFGGTWWLPLATYDQCACDPAGSIAQSFKCCGSGAGNCGSYYETLEGEGIEGRPVGSMDQAGSYISWIFDVHLRLALPAGSTWVFKWPMQRGQCRGPLWVDGILSGLAVERLMRHVNPPLKIQILPNLSTITPCNSCCRGRRLLGRGAAHDHGQMAPWPEPGLLRCRCCERQFRPPR